MMNLADIKKLKTKKYRREFGMVFLEGERFVKEIEKSSFKHCEIITSINNYKSRFKIRHVTVEQYARITAVSEPQGIAALIPLSEFKNQKTSAKAVFLDDVQDPGNAGTIIRNLAWFGGYTIYFSPDSVDAFNPKVMRSAAGGHFHVTIVENADFFETRYNYDECYVLDLNGKDINQMKSSSSYMLVLGNEANGIADSIRSLKDIDRFRIQGTDNIESLNVASAASMALYQLNK